MPANGRWDLIRRLKVNMNGVFKPTQLLLQFFSSVYLAITKFNVLSVY